MSSSTAPRSRRLVALVVVALAAFALPAQAQVLRSNLWITDGPVSAEVVSGNTLYLGGEFDRVGPAVGGWAPIDSAGKWIAPAPLLAGNVYCTAPDGRGGWFVGGAFDAAGTQVRANLAHFDAGGNLTAWSPTTNGPVYTLLLFAGRLYAGGAFTIIDGQTRNHLAVLDTLSGNVGTWNPNVDGDVNVLTPFGSTFLVGGQYAHLGGVARANLAGVDTAGTVWAWNPSTNGTVNAIGVIHRLVPNTVTIYVGGDFTTAGGQARLNMAALDGTDGSATFAQATSFNPSANGIVRALLIMGTLTPTFYVGGDFGNIGGQPRAGVAAINGSGLATAWNPGVGNPGSGRSIISVRALALRGTTMYVGGAFGILGGQARSNLGAVDTGTGATTAWNPSPAGDVRALALGASTVFAGGSFAIVGGASRLNLAALDLVSGEATAWQPDADAPVFALASVGGKVYAGGQFAHAGGSPHPYAAQLDPVSGQAGSWNPGLDGSVRCIGARALGGGKNLIYLGGDFANAMGASRLHLAAKSDDPAILGIDGWNPAADSTVNTLLLAGNAVLVGGAFHHVGGQARNYAAALDTVTGSARAWNPGPDAPVAAFSSLGSLVYAGGAFANVGGAAHGGVVAIDASSGSVQPWPAQVFGPVSAVAATAGAIYVGGVFTHVGAASQTNLAAIDPASGAATSWSPEPWTPLDPASLLLQQPGMRALAVASGSVYAGGVFATILRSPHSGVAGIFAATTGVGAPPAISSAPSIAVRPNPFREGVAFDVRVPRAGPLALRVYDAAGRLVRELHASAAPGELRIDWDGRDATGRTAPAGVYLVRGRSGAWESSARVVRVQ